MTLFLCLLPPRQTGPQFYVVIRATRKSSRFQGKGSNFISQLFQDPEYRSVPAGNWTRDLPLCSQAFYRLSYKIHDSILPANVDGRGVGDMAALDACSSERGLPVAPWPGCSVSKVSWDSADERVMGVSATWLNNTPIITIHWSTSRSRYSEPIN